MIAQRFRALGWVAVVGSAATGLYLISLQVAAERGKLEAVEAQIASAQREVRQLQTEMGTRASMRQLERWNGDVLALSAPQARQFLSNGAQLMAVNFEASPKAPTAPPPAMASIAVPKPVVISVPSLPEDATAKPAAPVGAVATAMLAKPKLQRVAMIDDATSRDVMRLAQLEGHVRP